MFPSRAERWRVALTPDDAAVALPSRSGQPGYIQSLVEEGDDWTEQLAKLASHCGAKRVKVDVVLADALVRYAVVPWDETSRSKRDDAIRIERALEPVLNSNMANWTVRMSPARYGKRRLVCAVETATVIEIEGKLTNSRMRLGRIEPFGVGRLSILGKEKGSQGCLVVASAGHLQGFGWDDDEVLWVRSAADGGEDARAAIERAHILSGAGFAFDPSEIRLGGKADVPGSVAQAMLRVSGEV